MLDAFSIGSKLEYHENGWSESLTSEGSGAEMCCRMSCLFDVFGLCSELWSTERVVLWGRGRLQRKRKQGDSRQVVTSQEI